MTKGKICLKLFTTMLTLSCFTLGGGYVMVPLMKNRFVDKLGWLPEDELLELTAIGQSSPGAIVINSSVLLGYRMAGLSGAVCALLGTALPPLVILSAVYYIYDFIRDNAYASAMLRGMQAGVAAVIADVVLTMAAPYCKKNRLLGLAVMTAAFCAAWFFDVNVAFVIIASGALGAVWALWKKRKGAAAK